MSEFGRGKEGFAAVRSSSNAEGHDFPFLLPGSGRTPINTI
jgi:hypothetical protein